MLRILVVFLLIPLLQCHSNRTLDDTYCWSMWSPCTVTCISFTPEAIEVDFARRWRIWLPQRCPNVPPPHQLTQFKKCSKSVPPCLELERILQPSPRTIYRLTALVMLTLLPVIPSVYICCKYSTGILVVRVEQSQNVSAQTSMMKTMLMADKMKNAQEKLPGARENP